jgi:hypothetical protein
MPRSVAATDLSEPQVDINDRENARELAPAPETACGQMDAPANFSESIAFPEAAPFRDGRQQTGSRADAAAAGLRTCWNRGLSVCTTSALFA